MRTLVILILFTAVFTNQAFAQETKPLDHKEVDTKWIVSQNGNEIQINDIPDNITDQIPSSFITTFSSGNYSTLRLGEASGAGFVLNDSEGFRLGEVSGAGMVLNEFELISNSQEGVFSKIRILVDEKTMTVQQLKTFSKDGLEMSVVEF